MTPERSIGCCVVFAVVAVWGIGHFAGRDLAESGVEYSGAAYPAEAANLEADDTGDDATASELQKLRTDTQKYITDVSVRYIAVLMTAFIALFVYCMMLHLQINELKEQLRSGETTVESDGGGFPAGM